MMCPVNAWFRVGLLSASAGALAAACLLAHATEFSVSPIRADLKPGALTETVTVTNHASARLRVNVKVMEWTQDDQGADVYKESGDLVYFPRQMDIEPESKRLVRLGAKAVAPATERAYRLFIEEQPPAAADPSRPQVAFFFRFSIPVFLPPPQAKPQPEIGVPVLDKGKLAFTVRNGGNQHLRVLRILVTDDSGHQQEVPGWYLLAGRGKSYTAEIPPEVCRKAKTLDIDVQGEDAQAKRKLDVDPARCV